jgi:hypothetical protein
MGFPGCCNYRYNHRDDDHCTACNAPWIDLRVTHRAPHDPHPNRDSIGASQALDETEPRGKGKGKSKTKLDLSPGTAPIDRPFEPDSATAAKALRFVEKTFGSQHPIAKDARRELHRIQALEHITPEKPLHEAIGEVAYKLDLLTK